mgnify:CR=1 FL=1
MPPRPRPSGGIQAALATLSSKHVVSKARNKLMEAEPEQATDWEALGISDGRGWRHNVGFLRSFSDTLSRRFVHDNEFVQRLVGKPRPELDYAPTPRSSPNTSVTLCIHMTGCPSMEFVTAVRWLNRAVASCSSWIKTTALGHEKGGRNHLNGCLAHRERR